MAAKKSTKKGKNFRGGGEEFFWLARIYTPDLKWIENLLSTNENAEEMRKNLSLKKKRPMGNDITNSSHRPPKEVILVTSYKSL